MSILRNLLGTFMPHLEARRTEATPLAALNAEVVHDVNGDESAVIFIRATATPALTYTVQGSPDESNFYDLMAYPYAPASVGGTLPQSGQPLVSEALTAIGTRMLCVAVGGLQKIRVRVSAFTSGSINVGINSDACGSISPYVRDQRASTLMLSATGLAGAAVTATLPAVAGLRHYIDYVTVTRSMSAAQIAGAAPTLVTTTNIPGLPSLSFGVDAAAVGVDKTNQLDFGGAGIGATAVGGATTIVCPIAAGVIWRVNVAYRLGL